MARAPGSRNFDSPESTRYACPLVETPATGKDEKAWSCRKCGDVNPPDEIHAYFDDVMDNETNMPECPPIMTAAMSRCAEVLFRHSKGEHVSRAEAGNAARLLIRRVERGGAGGVVRRHREVANNGPGASG